MKTNIKARIMITYLFICKTKFSVNKREKSLLYNFYFRQRAIPFLYFFCLFRFSLFFFSPYLFRFNFVVSERNVHYFLPTYLGGTFFPSLDVSERNNFFSDGGGGMARAPSAPPLRTRMFVSLKNCTFFYKNV